MRTLWLILISLVAVSMTGCATQGPAQSTVARHGLTSAQFQAEFDKLVGQGYRLTYVSGYAVGTSERFAALFEKPFINLVPWIARHGMTSAQLQSEVSAYVGKGYRLVLVNGYSVNNVDKYVAIWHLTPGPAWIARHGLTSAQYQGEFNKNVAAGFRLVHVSGYSVNNQAFYAAIWSQASGPAYVARHGLTATQYQQEFDTHIGKGFRLVVVSGYSVNNQDFYAAIWERPTKTNLWLAKHGLTAAQYQQAFNDSWSQGYRPILVNGYSIAGQDRYAAIWER